MQGRRGIEVAARRPALLLGSIITFVLVVDQASKAFIRYWLKPSQSIPVWHGVFYITHVRNTGAAFGLMPGRQPLFVLTSVAVVLGIAIYWWWARPTARWLVTSLGFIAGGATGNLIDRTLLGGRVTDFFDFAYINFPVFNLADSAILIGTVMLVIWVLLAPAPEDDAGEEAGTAAGLASTAATDPTDGDGETQ